MADEVVVAEESYGTGNLECYYKFSDESGNLKKIKAQRETSVTSLSQFFKSAFLPQGYPESVSQDYLQYQIWDSLQAFCSSITGTLATQAMLKGYGVGDEKATALAATITWILRSGTGMMGSILFAWFQGNNLDCYSKKWRLFADAVNDLAILLELVSPLFKSYFIFLAILSSVAKSIVGVAGGATKAAFTQHQARRDNMADVSAKDGSQETMVNLTALIAGLLITPLVSGNALLTWSLFFIFTYLHLYSNYRAVCAVIIETLNVPRLNIVVSEFLNSGKILPPDQVCKKEPVFFEVQVLTSDASIWFCNFSSDWFGDRTVSQYSSRYRVLQRGYNDFHSALPDSKESRYLMRLTLNSKENGGVVSIVLHRDSEPTDHIQCCFQAAVVDFVIRTALPSQQVPRCGIAGQRSFEAMVSFWNQERMAEEDCTWHMVALAHNFTMQAFPAFVRGLEESGWVTSRTHLGSDEWRATWSLRGLEAKKIL